MQTLTIFDEAQNYVEENCLLQRAIAFIKKGYLEISYIRYVACCIISYRDLNC